MTPRDKTLRAVDTIKLELADRLKELVSAGKLVEAQRLEQRTRFDLEMLAEIGHCKGIENYTRHLSGAAPGQPSGAGQGARRAGPPGGPAAASTGWACSSSARAGGSRRCSGGR